MSDERYTFEQTRARLDEILVQVRKKDTSLEQSLELLEEGVRLANMCNELIDKSSWDAGRAPGDTPDEETPDEGADDAGGSGATAVDSGEAADAFAAGEVRASDTEAPAGPADDTAEVVADVVADALPDDERS
jgi:exodeoxyribonuclease VII small subunit